MHSSPGNDFLRKKYISSIAFAAGVLLFLLPFVEVRCQDELIAKNTGLGLAVGSDFELAGKMDDMQDQFRDDKDQDGGVSKKSGKVYPFALAALLLGIGGLVLSFMNIRSGKINTIIGALAALSLMALMIHLNSEVKNKEGSVDDEFSRSLRVTTHYTLAYYISLLSFLAASFFSFRRGQLEDDHEKIPKNAPQLDLQNPGDQSEFPKSASESELG